MTLTALPPVTGAAAWRGDQLDRTQAWVYLLSPEQIAELETLGQRFVEDDPDLRFVQAADYPLDACASAIEEWGRDVDFGRGFVLVRGLRTYLYSDVLSAAIYYILGLHMGDPIRQNEMGDLVDSVYATSNKTMDDPTALSSKVRDKLVYHSDSSDVVALMCLRPAQSGGASCLVSGAEIYNEILRRRPDLAPLLLEPFHWDWRRQDHNAPANSLHLAGGQPRAGGVQHVRGQPLHPDRTGISRRAPHHPAAGGGAQAVRRDSPMSRAWPSRWISGPVTSSGCPTMPPCIPEPVRRLSRTAAPPPSAAALAQPRGRASVVPGFGKNGVVPGARRAAGRRGRASRRAVQHLPGRGAQAVVLTSPPSSRSPKLKTVRRPAS